MYLLWLYILITIIWKNYSKVLLVRLTVWYISNEKRCNTGWVVLLYTKYPHKASQYIWESLGFFFPYWIFFFIICIEQLAKYRFYYEARFNTSSFFYHICILENCVSVISMIGYFPYISILSSKKIEYLP